MSIFLAHPEQCVSPLFHLLRSRKNEPQTCVYLVDPAISHMLVSKLKPCKCKFTPRIRTGKTANGLGTESNPRDRNLPRWRRWITVAIPELIHVTQAAIGQRVVVVVAFMRVGTSVVRSASWCYILDWERGTFFRPPVRVPFPRLRWVDDLLVVIY